jgi:Kef-type K+ transport system membrane component KefB
VNQPIAPLAGPVLLVFLVQLGALLGLAIVLGRLAARLGMPQLVGELCAGVLLGPSLLGHAAPALSGWLFPAGQFDMLDGVGQLGMLLLVGVTGMSIDVGLLRRQGARAAAVSVPGLIIPLGLGVACGLLLPAALRPASVDHTVFAMFLGVALCVSALPVIAKILAELGFLHRDVGQLTIISASVDDVFGWLMLSIVAAMATTGVHAGTVATSVALLAGVLLLAVVVLRPAAKLLLRRLARLDEPGVTVGVLAVLVLLCAAGTQAVRMEALLGAFLCGVVIASTGLLDRAHLASLRTVVLSVLAPIFFATAGLRVDLAELASPVVALAAGAVVAVAVVGKFAGAYLGAWLIRMDRWSATALAAGLNARGIVGIVVASVGLRAGVLNTAGYTVVVLVAITTSVMASPLLRTALGRIPPTASERERELALSGAGRTP